MDLKQTAIHEAGHTVIGWTLGLTCDEVALTHHNVKKTGYYGHAVHPYPSYGYENNCSRRELNATLQAECVANCTGLAAEHVFFGVPLCTDNDNARLDFRNIIECERIGLRIRGKPHGCFVGDDHTWGYISRQLLQAKKLVKRNRDTIQRFADILVEKKKLSGEEVKQLLSEWLPR